MKKKLGMLSSAEAKVYKRFEDNIWKMMQEIFPRLLQFDGPSHRKNNVDLLVPKKRQKCEICGKLTDHRWVFPDPRENPLGQLFYIACAEHPRESLTLLHKFTLEFGLDKLKAS